MGGEGNKVMKHIAVAFLALSLSACGALVANTDTPQGVYLGIGDRPAISDEPSVRIVRDTAPPSNVTGLSVSGTSCKNKIWDPEPTTENALTVLKRQAKAAGMNTVYLRSIGDDPMAIAKNCWSAITATGVAIKS